MFDTTPINANGRDEWAAILAEIEAPESDSEGAAEATIEPWERPTLNHVADIFIDTYGFCPRGIYCSVTGRRVGWMDDEELVAMMNSIGAGDAEELADDLFVRLMASLRPSIAWNVMREETIANSRKTDPAGVIAYLVNKLFAPINSRRTPVQNLLDVHRNRILAFESIAADDVTESDQKLIDGIEYMLLEVDAKLNLESQFPPFACTEWLAADWQGRFDLMQPWYEARIKFFDEQMKKASTQIKWERAGCPVTKVAFRDKFLESKPPSKAAKKKAQKREDRKEMLGMLAEVLKGKAPETKESPTAEKKAPVLNPFAKGISNDRS